MRRDAGCEPPHHCRLAAVQVLLPVLLVIWRQHPRYQIEEGLNRSVPTPLSMTLVSRTTAWRASCPLGRLARPRQREVRLRGSAASTARHRRRRAWRCTALAVVLGSALTRIGTGVLQRAVRASENLFLWYCQRMMAAVGERLLAELFDGRTVIRPPQKPGDPPGLSRPTHAYIRWNCRPAPRGRATSRLKDTRQPEEKGPCADEVGVQVDRTYPANPRRRMRKGRSA
jgi:hypothetical protein